MKLTHKAIAFSFAIMFTGNVFGAANTLDIITSRNLTQDVTSTNVQERLAGFRVATRAMKAEISQLSQDNFEAIAQIASDLIDKAMLNSTAENFDQIKSNAATNVINGLSLDLGLITQAQALRTKLNTTFEQVQQAQETARLAQEAAERAAQGFSFNRFMSTAKNKVSSLFSGTEETEEVDTRTFAEAMAEQYAAEEAARITNEPAPVQDQEDAPVMQSRCSFERVWNTMTSKWMFVPAGFVAAYLGGAYDMLASALRSDAPAPVTGTEDNLNLTSTNSSSSETPKSAIELEADEMCFDRHNATDTVLRDQFVTTEPALREAAMAALLLAQQEQVRLENERVEKERLAQEQAAILVKEQPTSEAHEILDTCHTREDMNHLIEFNQRFSQQKAEMERNKAALIVVSAPAQNDSNNSSTSSSTQPSAEPAVEEPAAQRYGLLGLYDMLKS
ncbi:hypothetical protein K2X40_02815 [Candidatus Babeliales bacterium]|nr:hypothetical protein [Candidatus Babeliales bacterium]